MSLPGGNETAEESSTVRATEKGIKMDKRLFSKALDRIPNVVSQMCSYHGIDKTIIQTVNRYSPSGSLFGKDTFVIDENEMLSHIEKAKQMRLNIEFDDNHVTVTRMLSNGEKYVCEYRPSEAHAI